MDFLNDERPAEQVEQDMVPQQPGEQPAEEIILQQPAETDAVDAEQEPAPDFPKQPKKENWQKRLFKDAKDVLYMLAIFMLVYILCFRTVVVVGNSMYDTLVNGDRLLLASNLICGKLQQGDIIVASKDSFRDGECIIKRVIAVEGQKVDIDFATGTVYVDDQPLDEPYLYSETVNPEGVNFPVVVPEGRLFVMGDNRMDSLDSRSHSIGFIDEREILGKAIFLLLPGLDDQWDTRDYGRIGVIG